MTLLPDEILALTIWGEARGESAEGQIAVANVIMNRAMGNPDNIKSVCLKPKQFSCWNTNDPNYKKLARLISIIEKDRIPTDKAYRQCLYLGRGVMIDWIKPNVGNANHYMTVKLFNSPKRPSWAKVPKKDPKIIGNHIFLTI